MAYCVVLSAPVDSSLHHYKRRHAGVKRRRASSLNKMCTGAACAALAHRSDASYEASCAAFSELCAAAAGSPSVTVEQMMELVGQSALVDLFSQADGTELQAVFSALQSHMGWCPQQAAAALLDLELQPVHPSSDAALEEIADAAFELSLEPEEEVLKERAARLALLRTTAQHVEAVAELLR